MKRNSLTLIVGALLIVLFVLLLFTFQVRQTEIALITTFDRPSPSYITEPGFKLKWPTPIQKVYKFDKRTQTFDQDRIEETLTRDNYNVVVELYAGWKISKPDLFFSSFPSGRAAAAHPALEALVRGAKNAVVGRHPFSHFVSTDPEELRLAQIEREMLQMIQAPALNNYGIEIEFLGIKKLGLPESVTQRVFDRMIAERQSEIERLQGLGEAEAKRIRANADAERDQVLARASAVATQIKGEADAEAARSFAVFDQDPELAIFLYQLRAIEEISKNNATFFLDSRTSPFNLLTTNMWQRLSTNQFPYVTNNQLGPITSKAGPATVSNQP
jgi:modulator of FtsH protease HflC